MVTVEHPVCVPALDPNPPRSISGQGPAGAVESSPRSFSKVGTSASKPVPSVQPPCLFDGRVGCAFPPLRALLPAGSQPRGLGLDPSSSDPREAVVETATGTDPAEVGLGVSCGRAAPVTLRWSPGPGRWWSKGSWDAVMLCLQVPAEPGAAAALVPTTALRTRSEAVVCGICMDRVYEKPLPEERLFGILPNCSHAYCVGCIRKWRRSRDFQSTVIK